MSECLLSFGATDAEPTANITKERLSHKSIGYAVLVKRARNGILYWNVASIEY